MSQSPKVGLSAVHGRKAGSLAALLLGLGGLFTAHKAHAQSFVAEEIPLAPTTSAAPSTRTEQAWWSFTAIDNAGTVSGVRARDFHLPTRFDPRRASERFDNAEAARDFDTYIARAGTAPVLLAERTTLRALPVLGYGVGSSAADASSTSPVASIFWAGGSYRIGAFPWRIGGPWFYRSSALDMNTSGVTVGFSGGRWSPGPDLSGSRGFVWSPSGARDKFGRAVPSLEELPGPTGLPDGVEYFGSTAETINNFGVIGGGVGVRRVLSGVPKTIPVLWFGSSASDRVAIDLSPYFPTHISADDCRVMDINDQFVIVAQCPHGDVFYSPSVGRFVELSAGGSRIEGVNESSCFAATVAGHPLFSCPLRGIGTALDSVATSAGTTVSITRVISINDRNEILAEGPTEHPTPETTQQHYYVLRPR